MEDPKNDEALTGMDKIRLARDHVELADNLFKHGDYGTAVSVLTEAIEICSWSPRLRKQRAQCNLEQENYAAAVPDVRSWTKLMPDNTDGFFELTTLLYQLGYVEEALT